MSRLFVVEEVEFQLSSEVIEKVPMLKEMTKVWQGPIQLERVSLADFQAFVAYVNDGTIPEEANVKIFNYFHYPIDESYELSWKLESEMRNNFHSGEIYDKHHGLTIITEEMWEELVLQRSLDTALFAGPLPVKAEWNEIQKRLAEVQTLMNDYPMLFLAGGSLVSILFGEKPKDLDFFVYGVSEEEANEMLRSLLFRLRKLTVKRTKNAITFPGDRDDAPIQIILRLFESPSSVIGGFDIDCCGIGYDGTNIYLTNRALYAFKNCCNTVNLKLLSPSYERRLAKYGARGFAVRIPGLDFSFVNHELLNFDLLCKLVETTNIAYNYRLLAGGLDCLLFLDAHFHGLGCKDKTKEFFSKLCDYVSDYGTDSKAVEVDSFIREGNMSDDDLIRCGLFVAEESIFVRDPLGKYVIYNGQSEYSFLEMKVGSYYIESSQGRQSILNFPAKILEAMNLNTVMSQVEWKTSKPGEQMTTCFNSLVLEDESVWYQGRYSNLSEQPLAKSFFVSGDPKYDEEGFQFSMYTDSLFHTEICYVKDGERYDICDIINYELIELIGLDLVRKMFPRSMIKITSQDIRRISIQGDVATFKTSIGEIPVAFEGYFQTADDYTLSFDRDSSTYQVSEYTQSHNK